MNSHRRLPHSCPEGRWLFITWTLHGSLPSGRFPPPAKAKSGQAFAWIDRYLDNTRNGPQYLRLPDIAQLTIDSLYRGVELCHYELGPFVIMANHVHVLLKPVTSPSQFLKSLKGSTAREANRLLNRTGEQFWQRESYDHWVRDQQEWNRIARYIERNPVTAGVVARIEDYAWSSASSVHTSVDDGHPGRPALSPDKQGRKAKPLANAARKSACATASDVCATAAGDACATAMVKTLA